MELLVVIGIIAILAAVAFPAYNYAIISAKKAKCSSNLRQIGIGMLAFAADNNENLPVSGGTIPHGTVDAAPPAGSGKASWTEQLEPYVGKSTDTASNPIYQCPLLSNTGNAQYSYFNGCHAADPGGMASGPAAPINLMKIHSLSAFILSGDISFPMFTPNDADPDDYGQDPAFNGGTPISPVPITRHGGASNILFGDGHVESLKYFDYTVNTTVYPGPGMDSSGKPYDYLYPN